MTALIEEDFVDWPIERSIDSKPVGPLQPPNPSARSSDVSNKRGERLSRSLFAFFSLSANGFEKL